MLTKKQKQRRAKGIGGTDCAAILGLSPYKDATQVWLEKTGRYEQEESDLMYWGKRLENIIIEEYEIRTGKTVIKDVDTQYHPDYPWMIAHIDGKVKGEKTIVEAKTASVFTKDRWGEEGTDKVPDEYIIQCQHYMNVLNYERADVCLLMGGNDYRMYTIPRNDKLINMMMERLINFWEFNVLADIEPIPTMRVSAEILYKKDKGDYLEGTENDFELVKKACDIKKDIKFLEKQKKAIDLSILNRIKENTGIKYNDAIIASWKENKHGTRTLRTKI